MRMKDTRHAGMGPQDVFFIDKHFMLVAFTPNRVSERLRAHEKCRIVFDAPMMSRLVLFRLHFDLDELDARVHVPKANEFEELHSIEYAHSHPDSISYSNGVVAMSDQYRDQVNFIGVHPRGGLSMKHLGVMTGFHMNHGVALHPTLDLIAATQYGDNTVIISKFPLHLRDAIDRWRQALNGSNDDS
jgi:hypothetical protein